MKFNGKIYQEGWTPETPYYEERIFLTANETVKKAVSTRYAVLVKGDFIPANTVDEVKKVWETAPHALVFMIRPYKAETAETAETGKKKRSIYFTKHNKIPCYVMIAENRTNYNIAYNTVGYFTRKKEARKTCKNWDSNTNKYHIYRIADTEVNTYYMADCIRYCTLQPVNGATPII